MSGASRRGVARPSPRRRVAAAWSLERAARRAARHTPAPPAVLRRRGVARVVRYAMDVSNRAAGQGAGPDGVQALTAALCQRPRPPPVKAARSPKTRPRARSAPTLEPSNDERLPPSAFANSSSCTAKSARATTNRWPSSQQLEPRAPRPSRGVVACRPGPSTSCWHPNDPSATKPRESH